MKHFSGFPYWLILNRYSFRALGTITTMYDFHDSTDIFVNPSFLPFCTQKAPWISSKKQLSWCQKLQDFPEFKIRPWDHIGSYNTQLKHRYVHYKICPKMSVQLWKSYKVMPSYLEQPWEFQLQKEQTFCPQFSQLFPQQILHGHCHKPQLCRQWVCRLPCWMLPKLKMGW